MVVFHRIRKKPSHIKTFGAGQFCSQKISVPSVFVRRWSFVLLQKKQTKNDVATIETRKATKSFYSTQNF